MKHRPRGTVRTGPAYARGQCRPIPRNTVSRRVKQLVRRRWWLSARTERRLPTSQNVVVGNLQDFTCPSTALSGATSGNEEFLSKAVEPETARDPVRNRSVLLGDSRRCSVESAHPSDCRGRMWRTVHIDSGLLRGIRKAAGLTDH